MEIDKKLLENVRDAVRDAATMSMQKEIELRFHGYTDFAGIVGKDSKKYLDLVCELNDVLEVSPKLF